MNRPAALGLLLLLLVAGCSAPAPAPAAPGCVPGAPPPPTGTVEFEQASNVEITGADGYRVLTVRQPYPGGAPQSIVLVGCGQPDPALPADLAGAPVLRTPVTGVHAVSTTPLPFLTELDVLPVLTGVGGLDLISDPAVRAHVESGAAEEFAPAGMINAEQVVAAAPPVVLSGGTDDPAFAALAAAGIPVLGWADFLESGPLGQAEWIKVMGALTGRDAEAAAAYDAIADRYDDLATRVRGSAPTPIVAGQPYQGTWSVPSLGSTSGRLLADAGASWSGRDAEGGAVPSSLEAVLAADGDARIWLADGPWRTTADIAASDPRLTAFAAAGPGGQVWTRDKLLGPTGGNQAFERGIAHPDELLADLVSILHPELLPGHETIYYQQVPAG